MIRSANVLLPWSMWAMIEKLRMWSMQSVQQRAAEGTAAKAAAVKAQIAKRCEGRKAVPQPKKRHVQNETRLPTKRMATACWAFIVAKSTLRKSAPMLVFRSLQGANRTQSSTGYQQACHKAPCIHVWFRLARRGTFRRPNRRQF